MSAPKGWGLDATEGAAWHWSARALFKPGVGGEIGLLWDRMGVEGVAFQGKEELTAWLNEKAFPLLRSMARHYEIPDTGEVTIKGDGFTLRADARASCGYLYLSAEPDMLSSGSTPLPRVTNDTRTRCKQCEALPLQRHTQECPVAPKAARRQAREGGARDPDRRTSRKVKAGQRDPWQLHRYR